MTIQECIAWAAKASSDWFMNEYGVIRTTIDGVEHCPITAAVLKITGEVYDADNVVKATTKISLVRSDSAELIRAADNRNLSNPTIRAQLLTALKPVIRKRN